MVAVKSKADNRFGAELGEHESVLLYYPVRVIWEQPVSEAVPVYCRYLRKITVLFVQRGAAAVIFNASASCNISERGPSGPAPSRLGWIFRACIGAFGETLKSTVPVLSRGDCRCSIWILQGAVLAGHNWAERVPRAAPIRVSNRDRVESRLLVEPLAVLLLEMTCIHAFNVFQNAHL